MAPAMVRGVLIPASHGEWDAIPWILVILPHWYVGIAIPIWIAGLITGAFVCLPYVYCICRDKKRGLLGCWPPAAATAAQLAAAVDRDGVPVAPGDVVEVCVCDTPDNAKWARATLVRMRADDETWRVRFPKRTCVGFGAEKLRQQGSARPGEDDDVDATVAAAQAERIAELEAQVKSLTEWQQAQEAQQAPEVAAAVTVPEAVPVPRSPRVAPPGGRARVYVAGPTGNDVNL